ncbi:hypothetical protein F5890DRAFT_1541858 [Lentinula detonsa]|uniref:Uncharacterized protein n=1 Tax=Lentinula detonsa TaxID=2804962 RepID=A0AA38PRM5_9AGAR|nr:hypothetical protein F5890DRAFT_1541858 [Lentinula detonsa]
MHLSTTFLVFGLASVACAAPRTMNAKARNAGMDIDVPSRPELDNRGIPTGPVEGDTTLSGYLMPRQAGQDEALKKDSKKKKKKKVKIQEPPSAVTVQGDSDNAVITFRTGTTPLNDIDRTLFRIDFVEKFKKFMDAQKFLSFDVPDDIQIRYTLSPDPGAGGQPHKIVKFEFTLQKTCRAHPCTGFLDFSSGKFRISDSNGKTIYSVGPSSSQTAKLKMKNPSIPHSPGRNHRTPSTIS